jgi:hypothetical protein
VYLLADTNYIVHACEDKYLRLRNHQGVLIKKKYPIAAFKVVSGRATDTAQSSAA